MAMTYSQTGTPAVWADLGACDFPTLGSLDEVTERGVTLRTSLKADLLRAVAAQAQTAAPVWLVGVSAPNVFKNVKAHIPMWIETDHLSETIDWLEPVRDRVIFTARESERLPQERMQSLPILVSIPVLENESAAYSAVPSFTHAGIDLIQWIQEYLGGTQDRALRVARVPVPTFFAWRKRPTSVVRPATIAHGLRIKAHFETLTSALGREESLRRLSLGMPSILDMLVSPDVEIASAGLRKMADLAHQTATPTKVRRVASGAEYLGKALEIEQEGDARGAQAASEDSVQMTQRQVRELEDPR